MRVGLQWPVESYTTGDYLKYRERIRRHKILWATHLGDDVVAEAGSLVGAIGAGEVVMADILPGSAEHRSWGGVVVIRHQPQKQTETFYAVYGHMKDLRVAKGDQVTKGQELGQVAGGYTPENGWWKHSHLHFAIYTGPWRGEVLPGYWRPEQFWRTRLAWWHDPQTFIAQG